METYRITDSIAAHMTVRARQNNRVMEAVEHVTRDLNGMLAYNPTRKAWIDVEWRGKGWRVVGRSKLPSVTGTVTEYTRYVPLHRPFES